MATPKPSTELELFPQGRAKLTLEVAPGKDLVPLPPTHVDRMCLAELIPTGEPSTYRAVARVHEINVRLTNGIAKKLGLGGRSDTLRRLIKAGFVKGQAVAPRCYTFSLTSFFEHQANVRKAADEGTEFWTDENLQRYRAAI